MLKAKCLSQEDVQIYFGPLFYRTRGFCLNCNKIIMRLGFGLKFVLCHASRQFEKLVLIRLIWFKIRMLGIIVKQCFKFHEY